MMAAPGLVDSIAQGQRVAADPAVRKLMLSLGADKGLHGAGLFMSEPSDVVTKTAIRQACRFQGQENAGIFASQFQSVAFERLGATPVAMSLGDVVPAIQQGAIDGAVTGMGPIAQDAFRRRREIRDDDQSTVDFHHRRRVNRKWSESLPKDLQEIVDEEGRGAVDRHRADRGSFRARKAKESYAASGGEEINLSPDEQATFIKTLSSVGADVSAANPEDFRCL